MTFTIRETIEPVVMQARVAKLLDLTPTEIRAWSELAARAAMPNPLFEPGCLLPASHLTNGEQIYLAIAYSGSTMYGCFPFQIVDRWGGFRGSVMTTQVRRMQYDGTPLLDRDHTFEAARVMFCAIRDASRSRDLPGILINDWVDDDGPVAAALQRAAESLGRPAYRYREWERPMMRRRQDGDYSVQTTKVRRHVRRSTKRIAEELGMPVHVEDCTDDPGVLDRILELEVAGYKGDEGIAIAQHPGESQWFAEMCRNFRAEGRLHVLGLKAQQRYIAVQLMLRGGDGLFGLKMVYDQEFRKHGPGVSLICDVPGVMFSQTDADWLDTCTYSGNESLLRLYPDRRAVVSLVTPVGGMLDRRHIDTVRIARNAKARWSQRGRE